MVQEAGPASAAPAAVDPKLAALREAMAQADGGRGISAFIIPSEDPHMVRLLGAGALLRPWNSGSSCRCSSDSDMAAADLLTLAPPSLSPTGIFCRLLRTSSLCFLAPPAARL